MTTAIELQKAFGYLFEEEVQVLTDLADMLPSGASVMQIGAGSGTSTLAILESKKPSVLRTIDITLEDSPFGSLYAEKVVAEKADVYHKIMQSHGDSKEIIPIVYGGGLSGICDMVFIDGDHSYEGCKADIQNSIKYALKPSGILAIHDYKKEDAYNDVVGKAPHPKQWDGVTQAVDELLIDKYEQILYVRSLIVFRIE